MQLTFNLQVNIEEVIEVDEKSHQDDELYKILNEVGKWDAFVGCLLISFEEIADCRQIMIYCSWMEVMNAFLLL